MKKTMIRSFVLVMIVLAMVVPCSAEGSFPVRTSYDTNCLTPNFFPSVGYPPETSLFKYPSTVSGVKTVPMGQEPTYQVYVEVVDVGGGYVSTYLHHLHTMWYDKADTVPKEEYDQYIRFGDPSRQNGNDYVDIEYLGRVDPRRICFNVSPYEKSEKPNDYVVYKYPGDHVGYRFKLTFKDKSARLLSDYTYNDEFTYSVDTDMYMLPIVTFPNYKTVIDELVYDGDNGGPLAKVYFRVYRLDVAFGNAPAVYPVENQKYTPVLCFGHNFTVPFHNSTRLDTRYKWINTSGLDATIMLGTQIGGQTYQGQPVLGSDFPLHNGGIVPVKCLYSNSSIHKDNTDSPTTYVVTGGVCKIDARLFDVNASDDNLSLDWFMRVGCGRSLDEVYRWSKTSYNDYRLSWCAFSLYKQEAIIQNVATGSTDVNGVNLDSLYQPLFAEWDDSDGILSGIANFFTNLFTFTLPNIFNNFIVWLMCESPLISTFTKPLFLSAVQTKDFVVATLIPLLTTTGVFGVAFAVVLLIKVIVGWLK